MDRHDQLFQALADPSRREVLRAILVAPRCVEEIATALGLAASTVSHHLARLEAVGLAHKERRQYYIEYRADATRLDVTLRALLETNGAAGFLSGALGAQEKRLAQERRKVLATFFSRGRLERVPVQHRKRRIVLEAIAAAFESGRVYVEADVDAIIHRRFDDHCTIRRLMVDEGILERSKGSYRAPTARASPKGTAMQERKQKILAWKLGLRPAGVFAIRNTKNGRVLLGSSLNLNGPLNRHRFQLTYGNHPNRSLQQDWSRDGAECFTFEILEVVERRDDPDLDVTVALAALEAKWIAALEPFGDRTYNTTRRIRQG